MPRIHNVGRKVGEKQIARKIIFPQSWGADGKPSTDENGKTLADDFVNPGQHKNVTPEQYAHLKKLFGHEIVNLDDIGDLQSQLGGATEERKRAAGYLSPEEVQEEKRKAVAEALGNIKQIAPDEQRQPGEQKQPGFHLLPREELVQKIDAMDRVDLIALIERERLGIEHKSMRMDSLKALVLESFEKRLAEDKAA